MPTATKASLPNKPKIQQIKERTLIPPPTAIELLYLLKKQEAPKQIPERANIAANDPKQNNNVLTGTHLTALPLLLTSKVEIPSLPIEKTVITTYIAIIERIKNKNCVLTTVLRLVGVDKT